MNSRIYKGWVRHRRVAPTRNHFRYRLFMLYLDLAELPRVFDGTPFWSAKRWAVAWFRRADFLGSADVPLDTAVRDLVEARSGARPDGPIRLLTHLRYFGYSMNPVSFYYCFDATGTRLDTIVAEITNTPWKERHQYVLPVADRGVAGRGMAGRGAGGRGVARGNAGAGAVPRLLHFDFDKAFHVSPFLPMDMQYRWCFSEPLGRLFVNMQNFREGEPMFDATLAMKGEPVTPWALLRTLGAFPWMTLKVIAAIHWQALRLWLKGTPFFSHPEPRAATAPALAAATAPALAAATATASAAVKARIV